MADRNKMTVKEFRELGYLQELNRLFLHPLGMAMEVVVEEDGTERFGLVWDSRDDVEGFIFGEGMIDRDKALRIKDEMFDHKLQRLQTLGYIFQPIPDEEPDGR